MHKEKVQSAIIIIKGIATNLARQAVAEIAPAYIVEIFEEKDLLVNITEHELVPRHIRMSQ